MAQSGTCLYILDLDRTLLDTEKMMQLFVATCEMLHIDAAAIRQAERESWRHGQSFQALEILKTIVSTEVIEHFQAALQEEATKYQLLYPDAARLLSRLDSANADYMILTYGHTDWQRMKIQATGLLHVHTVIVQEVVKASLLNDWVQKDSIHIPKMGAYKTVYFIDDKPISFRGLLGRYQSYYLQRTSKEGTGIAREQQISNIQTIRSLDEVRVAAFM